MQVFVFDIKDEFDTDEAWEELEAKGCTLLYSSEEPGGVKNIYGLLPNQIDLTFKTVKSVVRSELASIDWESQWKAHGLDFYDGVVHLDLSKYTTSGKEILLHPGPGFGDLSHATTRLALELIAAKVKRKRFLDIGCGSGVLSLAAIGLGALSAQGIDIDPQAIKHAEQNAKLNKMEKKTSFCLPSDLLVNGDIFAAMNMIESEQVEALESLKKIRPQIKEIVTSGILSEERSGYLKLLKSWGWKVVLEVQEEGWSAFYCK